MWFRKLSGWVTDIKKITKSGKSWMHSDMIIKPLVYVMNRPFTSGSLWVHLRR